ELPRPTSERWRHGDELVQRVRDLAHQLADEEIATRLNAEGLRSNKGNAFTRASISWIRYKHSIPPAAKRKPDELTVKEVAEQFKVSPGVGYYWITHNIVPARRLNQGSPYWITINYSKARELERWVRES